MSDDAKKSEDELECGFNDQELEDIMSEIETLESDYTGGDAGEETPKNEVAADVVAEEADETPTQGESDIMDAVENELEADEDVPNNVVPMGQTSHSTPSGPVSETQLDFSIAGQMKVHLNFNLSGQQVALLVDEKDGLVIQMPGGAKFTIPLDAKGSQKKSA